MYDHLKQIFDSNDSDLPNTGISYQNLPKNCNTEAKDAYEELKALDENLSEVIAFSIWLDAVRSNFCNGINTRI